MNRDENVRLSKNRKEANYVETVHGMFLLNLGMSAIVGAEDVWKEPFKPDVNTVLLLHFDDSDKSGKDSSGKGSNGVFENGASFFQDGKLGGGLRLDEKPFLS